MPGPISSIESPGNGAIARTSDWVAYDALNEPTRLLELVLRMDHGDEIEAAEGRFSFHRANGVATVQAIKRRNSGEPMARPSKGGGTLSG